MEYSQVTPYGSGDAEGGGFFELHFHGYYHLNAPRLLSDEGTPAVPHARSLADDRSTSHADVATTDWQLAHKLKGSAGTVGFHGFTEPAQRLTDAARATDWPRPEQALSEIESLARRVVAPRDGE